MELHLYFEYVTTVPKTLLKLLTWDFLHMKNTNKSVIAVLSMFIEHEFKSKNVQKKSIRILQKKFIKSVQSLSVNLSSIYHCSNDRQIAVFTLQSKVHHAEFLPFYCSYLSVLLINLICVENTYPQLQFHSLSLL